VPADPGQQLDYLGLTVMNYIVATNGGEAKFSQEVKEKLIQASHTGAFQQQGGPRAAGLLIAQAGATEARKKDFALLGKLSYRIKQLIKTRHDDNTNRLMSEFFDLFPKLVQPVSSSSSSDVTIDSVLAGLVNDAEADAHAFDELPPFEFTTPEKKQRTRADSSSNVKHPLVYPYVP